MTNSFEGAGPVVELQNARHVLDGPRQRTPGQGLAIRSQRNIIYDMQWGSVEAEPEVLEWLFGLSDAEFGRAAFYVDLLEEEGVLLGEPYTRQLRGKLRELRFYLGRSRFRISYFVTTDRRIILLTVFHKQAAQESREIRRALDAMDRCIREKHVAPQGDD